MSMRMEQDGRVPAEPGSRPSDQAPTGLDRPGFDPSRTAAPYSRDDITALYAATRVFHDCLEHRCAEHDERQMRFGLRDLLREVETVLLGILSRDPENDDTDTATRSDLIRRCRMLSMDETVSKAGRGALIDASNALVAADRAIQRAAEGFDPQRRDAVARAMADLTYEASCTMAGMAGDTFSSVEARGIRTAEKQLRAIAFKRTGVRAAMARMFPSAASATEAEGGDAVGGSVHEGAVAEGQTPEHIIAELERELGVKGASAVFRKALALAKEAAAKARSQTP